MAVRMLNARNPCYAALCSTFYVSYKVELYKVMLHKVELYKVMLHKVELYKVELYKVELYKVELYKVELYISPEILCVEVAGWR